MTTQRELPRYRCQKEVHALKIARIERDAVTLIHFEPAGQYEPVQVSFSWDTRHRPNAGGYYVVYADGYTGYSPAAAFESGYTLIE